MQDVILNRFQPLHLKLEGVGPFRSAFELPLTGKSGDPANFFLLVSRNGFGKTTILETIHGLMEFLSVRQTRVGLNSLRLERIHPDLADEGRAQLDIRLELEGGATASKVVVLSLCMGTDAPLRAITPSILEAARADLWVPAVLSPNRENWGKGYVTERPDILNALREYRISLANYGRHFSPNGEGLHLPTTLYFTADRRILRPKDAERAVKRPEALAYGTAHKFETDGTTWETSLDGLLVWYEWVGQGLFGEARDLVNNLLFTDGRKRLVEIDRYALGAVIEVEHEDGTIHRHGLDRLSHGERALMHLLVRSAYHRTGSTILLIDEMETHLHIKWQHRLMKMLKDWIRQWPDLTVIATSHQPEMMDAFAFEQPEDGLVKGGFLIEADDL